MRPFGGSQGRDGDQTRHWAGRAGFREVPRFGVQHALEVNFSKGAGFDFAFCYWR
jgi:hypothetical protein